MTGFGAGARPEGAFDEVGRWGLRVLGDLRSLRSALRSALLASSAGQDHPVDGSPDRLLLVANELASNALRHGRGDAVVVLLRGADGWLLDVSDAAPDREPAPAADRTPGLGGYGLHLVAELGAATGWYADGGRKHVWSRLVDSAPGPVRDRG